MEAAWRLQEFLICFRSHSVVRLAVHTENQQQIIFEEKNPSVSLDNWKTTMTAWFDLNKMDVFAKNINYINIPQHYVFNNQNKACMKRQRNHQFNTIGRMSIVSPEDTERFYLKLLLYKMLQLLLKTY